MLNPFGFLMLAIEAQTVIGLRLTKLAWGGAAGRDEATLMVAEKMSAAIEATGTLMSGGSLDAVVSRYREHVAANTLRLSA